MKWQRRSGNRRQSELNVQHLNLAQVTLTRRKRINNMLTLYDVILPLGILLAMFLSKTPKKGAVAFCVCCALALIAMDEVLTGWAYFYYSVFIELFAAMGLVYWARKLKNSADRTYFRTLGVFFILSAFVTTFFITDQIQAHTDYVLLSHSVAICHVVYMLVHSDGIRNLVRNIHDRMSNFRFGSFNL